MHSTEIHNTQQIFKKKRALKAMYIFILHQLYVQQTAVGVQDSCENAIECAGM